MGSCCVKSPEATSSAKATPRASGLVIVREKNRNMRKAMTRAAAATRRVRFLTSSGGPRHTLQDIIPDAALPRHHCLCYLGHSRLLRNVHQEDVRCLGMSKDEPGPVRDERIAASADLVAGNEIIEKADVEEGGERSDDLVSGADGRRKGREWLFRYLIQCCCAGIDPTGNCILE